MISAYSLDAGALTLDDLRALYFNPPASLVLPQSAWAAIAESEQVIAARLADGGTYYGINTGFGRLASTRIPPEQVEELQRRLILSHCVGVGDPLPDDVVRLILVLKIACLARGHSGVRRPVIAALLALYNADVLPLIPGQGSVGASGDLAPLAHLSAVLLGVGQVRVAGETMPAADGLAKARLAPLKLAAKEGLALLNGTQVSTALALSGLFKAERVFNAALIAGAMTTDAAAGSDTPFDARIHDLRGHPGQIAVAEKLRDLLADSEIRHSHEICDKVQDPYCLRCQPQVMGAVKDQLDHAARILTIEANAVTDNPLVFADSGDILSGGNFHAEPVGFAADIIALAIAECGALAERRIAMLVDASFSGLPAFLVKEGGLNSGFMIAHVTAAALTAENRQRANPCVVDSLPTSANQEDHVSMATHGARRLADMTRNAARIIGIELMAAAQGIDLRRPLRTSPPLEAHHETIRAHVPVLTEDRYLADDLELMATLVETGALLADPVA